MSKIDELQKTSNEHLEKPKAGDYWHECFSPILVVLKVIGNQIIYCQKTKSTSNNKWTWDLDEVKIINKQDFVQKMKYKTTHEFLKDKTWAYCSPESHKDISEYWENLK